MKAVLLGSYLVSLGLVAVLTAPIHLDEPSSSRPKNLEEVRLYLKKYGYLTMESKGSDVTDESFRKALQKYQRAFRLSVTGEVNKETLELMGAPRCGVSDNDGPILNRRKRFSTDDKWPQNRIPYAVQSNCANRPIEFLRDAVVRAFKLWSSAAPLEFYETNPQRSLIAISCRKRDHGDGAPFDGPGSVLAHAYSPPGGATHFDDDEVWTDDSTGINLYQVATHELGHALGLGHSTEFNAVMYPHYNYRNPFTLHQDDIQGIQSLYGPLNSLNASVDSASTTSTTSTLKTTEIIDMARIPTEDSINEAQSP